MTFPARIALYVPEPLENTPLHPGFHFRFGTDKKREPLFNKNLPPNFFETVAFVPPEEAQAIVLPHNFKKTNARTQEYVRKYASLGERLDIPVYLFSMGDFTDRLSFDPRVKVFLPSVYRSTLRPNDIAMPTMVDDLGKDGITYRSKRSVPLVSFCGQARYSGAKAWLRYGLKIAFYRAASLFYTSLRARTIGVYWRRALINACRKSPLLETNFILRRSFSGNSKTIELSPERARQEFVESVTESDFVLAPKGDGNYSNRFLEALCAGRIPVVVDTDIVLPLERQIPYEKIMVRVPMSDVQNAPRYIREFYDALSEEEWKGTQRLSREIFEGYLRQDAFYGRVFSALPQRAT